MKRNLLIDQNYYSKYKRGCFFDKLQMSKERRWFDSSSLELNPVWVLLSQE